MMTMIVYLYFFLVMKNFQMRMKKEKVSRSIVVIKKEITNHANRSMKILKPDLIFDVFGQQELIINIMEHILVPRHILLSNEEKKQLLEKYSVKESQLPRIQKSDAVSRYLGLERGQIVKIIRNSE